MNKLLTNPTILNIAAVTVALIGAIYIGLGILSFYDSQFNKAVRVVSGGRNVYVNGVVRENGLDFTEQLEVKTGFAQLAWGNGNTLVGFAGASMKINQQSVEGLSGYYYIKLAEPGEIILAPNLAIRTNSGSGVYNTLSRSFTVMSGVFTDTLSKTYGVQEVVVASVESNIYNSSKFSRELLDTNSIWVNITAALSQLNIIEPWLLDRTPPQVVSILPNPADIVTGSSIQIRIVVDDPTSKVRINTASGSVNEDNSFSIDVALAQGANQFEIELTDEFGNSQTQVITYTRQVIPEQPSPSSSPNTQPSSNTAAQTCNDAAFRQQLVTLINTHRQENSLSALSLNSSMNNAACKHSIWMNNTGNLSHVGSGNSQPWDRCSQEGTSCDAENIAMNSNTSAQNFFDQWKNSPGHNANMLGDHSAIGIGLFGNYATTVFN